MKTVEEVIRKCIEDEKRSLCGTKIEHGKQKGKIILLVEINLITAGMCLSGWKDILMSSGVTRKY